MILTEEEARKKRGYHNGCGEARIINGEAKNFCIASECMAWRWAKSPKVAHEDTGKVEFMGWCGLAGRPEAP